MTNESDPRRTQMKWLLGLTALSLVPVYILIGWQTSGHGPDTVMPLFWVVEAGAWGLRALVESAALIYLFQTVTDSARAAKILVAFECALIGLVALTVGLVIIANGNGAAISTGLPAPLYWFWSFGVAAFAPLMMGSVGFAYKVHQVVTPAVTIDDTRLSEMQSQLTQLSEVIDTMQRSSVKMVDRRQQVLSLKNDGLTQVQIAKQLGVSLTTIRADIKALNGAVRNSK